MTSPVTAKPSSTEIHPLCKYERIKASATNCLHQIAYAKATSDEFFEDNEQFFNRIRNAIIDALASIPKPSDASGVRRRIDTEREVVRLCWILDRHGVPAATDELFLLAGSYKPTKYEGEFSIKKEFSWGLIPSPKSPFPSDPLSPIKELEEIELISQKEPTPLYTHIRNYWMTNRRGIENIVNALLKSKPMTSFSGIDFPAITDKASLEAEVPIYKISLERLEKLHSTITSIIGIFLAVSNKWGEISRTTDERAENDLKEAKEIISKNNNARETLVRLNMQVSSIVHLFSDRLSRFEEELNKIKTE